MKRTLAGASLIVLTSSAVFAQTNPPSFEVASVKQAAPQDHGRFMVSMSGDPGRVDYKNVSLKQVLARAYGVKQSQINGPSWLDSERYDITAKVPDGVPVAQVPAMLQSLLADRFKMAVRKESKEEPVYALIVGKGGPKLKKADENAEGPVMAGLGPDGDLTVQMGHSSMTKDGAKLKAGAEGEKMKMAGPSGPGGGPGRGGAMTMSMGGHGGNARMQVARATMGSFADMLSNMLDRPVLNMTEIEGNYEIALDVSMEDMVGMKRGIGGRGPMMAGGGGGGEHGPAPDAAPSASIFQAVQTLGLKLEPRKAPVDRVIVENAEKVPTEN